MTKRPVPTPQRVRIRWRRVMRSFLAVSETTRRRWFRG